MSKLYVVVRGDLSKSQQAVQACHAVAEFMLWDNEISCSCGGCAPEKYWKNETIVLLKVKDEDFLRSVCDDIKDSKNPYNTFYEPDLDSTTAIACFDYNGRLEKYFEGFPLL